MANTKEKNILNVQPQSLEGEQAVLGSMLTNKEAVAKAMQWLSPEHFYKDAHSKIFSVMIGLFHDSEPIDTISVVDKLKKNKELKSVGGAYYITGLVEAVPTTANVESYAKIVLEKALLRQLILLSHELASKAYDDREGVDDILDSAERAIFNITQKRLKGGFVHLDPILHDSFEALDAKSTKGGIITGVPSGLVDLDNITAGFHPGELIVIAGRPSMGKTALALTIARNAAVDNKHGVGIFSLEMANQELAMRMLCSEARVNSHLVRTGHLPQKQWKNLSIHVGVLAEAPIYIDDSAAITVLEVRSKARRLMAEHDIELIIVDYLQLMQGPRNVENRQQEISVITRSLKALAKELNLPVIALSQLSRAVESRNPPIPQLSDLRESGAIEQDSDVVMFLYRKWFYDKFKQSDSDIDDFEDKTDQKAATIIVAKQRNGPTGTIKTAFIEQYARFENLARYTEDKQYPHSNQEEPPF
ncbi:MAG: replicative DNA helicase [Planctomycetia bacterium]|nr:replicative DNA helicase [Planctomycetia bacterium]